MVEDLIAKEQTKQTYERAKGIPKLAYINWKEKKPHRMLRMSKAEFRRMAGQLSAEDFILLGIARGAGAEVRLPEDLPAMRNLGRYALERLIEIAPVGQFWQAVRYLQTQGSDVSFLRDYWEMAAELQMDLENKQVRWPKSLRAAHDRAMEQRQALKDRVLAADFEKRLAELLPYAWEDGGILIRPCATEKEMRQEGKSLSHCVARYAADHAAGKTAILFIRRVEAPDKPWFTLELDEKELVVRQNRGKHNCGKTEEVQAFEDKWLARLKEARARRKKGGRAA